MQRVTKGRAARPALVVVALGAALSGCGLPEGGYGQSAPYSSYSSPTYYHPPSHYRSHRSENHHRSSSQPRTENWSQQRLQQHWVNQAQRPR
ncbi:MAG: hypothetical protein AVDCRST_MAG08-3323 [uncultured Acetobacteraceae bacterium]|jgi:hypothetical protein|uniref:Lipoprotein n=1 Tax=uncultured Acetobacteraceae bacterium TaxID=169975 RepID=A0A6J4J8K4_9PROT|nr:MAG: hypothetical protein AVDCRST_MAG08-3323 [uncultured Acetobacteraceae bacterium]